MSSRYETLLVDEVSPRVMQVTLNRPHVRNALNTQMGRNCASCSCH